MKQTKKSYPETNDFNKYDEIEKEINEASDKATEENLVGFLFGHQVADGYAQYRVTEDKGGNNITLQHINNGDAWEVHPSMIRGLRRDDLIWLMRFNKTFYSKKS